MNDSKYRRSLFCPMCGASVVVEFENSQLPYAHVIPKHDPVPPVNTCAGLEITVTIDWATCSGCGKKTIKSFSGLCVDCYSKDEDTNGN